LLGIVALAEDQQSDRLLIVVDSSKASRCKWCGTLQSKNWVSSEYGTFCSSDCSLAARANSLIGSFCLLAVLYPFLILMGGPSGLSTIIVGSMLLILVSSPLMCCGMMGLANRTDIPKTSRYDETSTYAALLKTVASQVKCPRCDANLDLAKVGEGRVYHCDYCGASGTVELQTEHDQSDYP
jgi:hypothetical protein